jgi:hypothetical protein
MMALFCWSATAQNGVTVSNLDVEPGTVTFNVSWKKADMPPLWSDTVWVFVDYNNAGKMERLPITSATATAGIVEKISGNDTGVKLIGNARTAGSFSATVQLHTAATATLSGACAYASNYPPVGEYTATNKIEFTGTQEYNIVLKHSNGTTDTLQSGKLFLVPDGDMLKSFSDKTGAPGMMKCIVPDNPIGTPNSRCGEGEVTISAASPSINTVIDWYDVATGGTPLLSGNDTYTTPSIGTSTTYYAQARDMITHCVSASRVPVVATVNVVPTITLSSKPTTASQTVNWYTPITDIVYTTADATIALSSGSASLPAGVTGTPAGTSFTISGTPTKSGTFTYLLTATNLEGGCISSPATGRVTARLVAPAHVASSTIWTFGPYAVSDYLAVAPRECTASTTTAVNTSTPMYHIHRGTYYYNPSCADIVRDDYCSPWHGPDWLWYWSRIAQAAEIAVSDIYSALNVAGHFRAGELQTTKEAIVWHWAYTDIRGFSWCVQGNCDWTSSTDWWAPFRCYVEP